ncbi:MAG: hypothetical protein GY794_14745, partial [bacterium]|nr:hypothetical protein [bacterium]
AVPGLVSASGQHYNIARYETDTESRIIYGGDYFDGYTGSVDYSSINNDGPGGSGGDVTGGYNFSLRARAFIRFTAGGEYSISAGSDDGRRIQLTEAVAGSAPGYTGFTARGGQVTGAFASGDTAISFDGPTGYQHTTGVFTVAAGDILALDTFFFELGGADLFHVAIKAGSDTDHGGTSDGWQLLEDGVAGALISSDVDALLNMGTDTATVTVTIHGVNDAPTTAGITDVAVDEDAPATVINLGAAFDDIENTDAELTYTVTTNTNPSLFSSTDISGTELTLAYAANANGSAAVTVRATDPEGLFVETTFNVAVAAVNDAPVANDDSVTTDEDTAVDVGDVLANDADVDGDSLRVVSVDPTSAGGASVEVAADGSITYDPSGQFDSLAAGETATDTFTYAISDAQHDGLFNVAILAADEGGGSTDHDLQSVTETLAIWNAIDAGAAVPGLVSASGQHYNIARYETDTESRIIYGGDYFDGY